jgi:hypothetical protein
VPAGRPAKKAREEETFYALRATGCRIKSGMTKI